jgi:hypothetical protein
MHRPHIPLSVLRAQHVAREKAEREGLLKAANAAMAKSSPSTAKRKRGPKAPWQDFVRGKLSDRIKNTGLIPENGAEVARLVLPLIKKTFGTEPDPSHLERFIGDVLREARRQRAQRQVIPTREMHHPKRKPRAKDRL